MKAWGTVQSAAAGSRAGLGPSFPPRNGVPNTGQQVGNPGVSRLLGYTAVLVVLASPGLFLGVSHPCFPDLPPLGRLGWALRKEQRAGKTQAGVPLALSPSSGSPCWGLQANQGLRGSEGSPLCCWHSLFLSAHGARGERRQVVLAGGLNVAPCYSLGRNLYCKTTN